MKKKVFSRSMAWILSVVMVFGVFVLAPITANASTGGHTQEEAVAWAQAQVGKYLDYDGAYGSQCVDLIAFYYQYLGNTTPGGNGCDYCRNALPSGWQRITNYNGYTPEPGDICVWDSYAEYQGEFGHVGIVVGGDSSRINTIEQNIDGSPTKYFSRATAKVSCFIRPDFVKDPPTPDPVPINTYLDIGTDFYSELIYNKGNMAVSNVNGNVEIQPRNKNSKSSVWYFSRQSDGSYIITSPLDNKAIDVTGGEDVNAANVQVYTENQSAAQRWYLTGTESEFTMRPGISNSKVMDVNSGNSSAGTNVFIYSKNDSEAQNFSINKVDAPVDLLDFGSDFYAELIYNKGNMAVSNVNGNVEIRSRDAEQKYKVWHFVRQSDGSYVIISCSGNKAIDILNNKDENGTNIQVWQAKDEDSQEWYNGQKWFFYGKESEFRIQSAICSRGLDVDDGKTDEGTNIQLWLSNNTSAQYFSIHKLSSPQYTIGFNANGGTGTMSSFSVKPGDTFTIPGCKYTRDGFYCKGYNVWRKSGNGWYVSTKGWLADSIINQEGYTKKVYKGGESYIFDDFWTDYGGYNDSYVFYPIWEKINYTLNYNANGGSGSISPLTLNLGSSFVIAGEDSFSMDGYELSGYYLYRSSDNTWDVGTNGWAKESELKEKGYSKKLHQTNAKYTFDTSWSHGASKDEIFTFYAVWKAKVYTVTFNMNGGDGYIDNQSKPHDQDLTLSTIVPTRTDYRFIGWNTDKNATTAQYLPGDKYNNNSDATLYAIWAVNHNYTTEVIVPTCTEQGYTLHTCTNCGDSYKDTYTDPTGHKYTEKVIAPTVDEQGYTLHTCSVCGHSYKDNYTNKVLVNKTTLAEENVKLGSYITINASAAGGTGGYTYAVWYKRASASSWTTKQKYSTNAEIKIKPAAAVKYNISVKVKDSSGKIVKKAFTVNVFEALKNTSTVPANVAYGSSINIKASAKGGLGTYQYEVFYKQASSSKWTKKQSYSTNRTISFKPKAATTYDISVKVKDSRNVVVKKRFKVSVTKPTNTSKVAATSIKLGSKIQLTCSAKGGTGFYQYAVYYKRASASKWTTKQSYSSNTSITIKPAAKTTYKVSVRAKDSNGNVSKKYFTITVT